MRQQIDLRTLIEQCTGYLRDAGFCERSVVEFNRYMRFGLLAYAEENGITSYTTSLGNEYIAFLKHKKCFTAGRKKALFTFHSFAVRGMVAAKRSYGDILDDFMLNRPDISDTEIKVPLSFIVKDGIKFLMRNDYCIDTINRYIRIWNNGLCPFLKYLGYDYYTKKLGGLFLSVYHYNTKISDRTKRALNILDDYLDYNVSQKGNHGLYEQACLLKTVSNSNLQEVTMTDACVNKMHLDKIISLCSKELRSMGYTEEVIERNEKIWNAGLLPFAKEYNIEEYTPSLGAAFKKLIRPLYKGGTHRLDRSIYILDSFLEHGSILYSKNQEARNIMHESPMWQKAEVFLEYLRNIGRKETTVINHATNIYRFIDHLYKKGIIKFEDVKDDIVLEFIEGLRAKKHPLNSIRMFALFLYYQGFIDYDFGFCIKRDGFISGEKLPSVYSKDEILTIEKSINQASAMGKRDYAMILLMARLGMRTSDVCRLKFSDLDWDNNKIRFVQYKTGNPLELPLLKDVGEAIINYLKFGRPKSDLPYIFLTAHSPYRKISKYSSNVQKIISDSRVNIGGRKHGTHSLRHSLASQMLANGVPLPIISASLGHNNTQATMDYLRIDTKQLIKCELDVPCVDKDFFIQNEEQYIQFIKNKKEAGKEDGHEQI